MTLSRLRLSVADARDLSALRSIGYHNDEARIIADHVIDAAICGYEYSGLAKILKAFRPSGHFALASAHSARAWRSTGWYSMRS